MARPASQLSLFKNISLNPTYEIKRLMRIALDHPTFSRDDIVKKMNEIAVKEGMQKIISTPTLESWLKDSEPRRLPPLPWLTIFCKVLDTIEPITAMIRPLGADIVGLDDMKLLVWARAEREKKVAAKRARLAEQELEF